MPKLANEPGMAIYFDKSDLAQFHAVFKQLGINAARPWRFLNLAELVLRKEVALAYAMHRAPNGTPWPPLKPATIAARGRRKKRGRTHKRSARKARDVTKARKPRAARKKTGGRVVQTLRDTGTMVRSLTSRKMVVPPAVIYGYGDEKAPWHQQVGKKQLSIAVKGQRPPVRKTLPEKWNTRMSSECFRALKAQLKEGGVGRYLR